MRIFISGGCKNGKSYAAQRIAAGQSAKRYYVATMLPSDGEDEARIARHRADRRGWGFETIEQHTDICGILRCCDKSASFLLDSVTALLSNEMFPGGVFEAAAEEKVRAGLTRVVRALPSIVLVSDYIYADGSYSGLTQQYMRSLAAIDRMLARECETVLEVTFSSVICHKGGIKL